MSCSGPQYFADFTALAGLTYGSSPSGRSRPTSRTGDFMAYSSKKSTIPEALLLGAEFEGGFDPKEFSYDPNSGFLYRKQKENVLVLGAAAIGGEWGLQEEEDGRYTPLTALSYLPSSAQQLTRQGKGVGPRLYNLPLGPASWQQGPRREIGMFTLELTSQQHMLYASKRGGKVGRVALTVANHLRGLVLGTSGVVNRVHKSYGDADVVRLTVPPQALVSLGGMGLKLPQDFDPAFMLVRNPTVPFTRVGTVLGTTPN